LLGVHPQHTWHREFGSGWLGLSWGLALFFAGVSRRLLRHGPPCLCHALGTGEGHGNDHPPTALLLIPRRSPDRLPAGRCCGLVVRFCCLPLLIKRLRSCARSHSPSLVGCDCVGGLGQHRPLPAPPHRVALPARLVLGRAGMAGSWIGGEPRQGPAFDLPKPVCSWGSSLWRPPGRPPGLLTGVGPGRR